MNKTEGTAGAEEEDKIHTYIHLLTTKGRLASDML